MKSLFLGIFMTASVLTASAQQSYSSNDGMLHVNLEKAIAIALDENPTIRVAEKEVELKVLADEEAWQALLPEIAVNGSLQHTLLAAEMKLGDNSFKMGRDNTNTVNVGASLNVPIFAPTVYQNMKLTKEDIKLAQEKARGSKLELINQVTKAYYQALLAKDSYLVMKQSYETSKLNYDIISERERVGKVSEYDKLSAEVQMRSMNSSMVSAENGETLAMLQLKVLMGVTANIRLAIDDRLENYEAQIVIPQLLDQERQLLDNSAMRQFDLSQSLLDRSYKVAKAAFLPTVSFTLAAQYQSLYNNNWEFWNYSYSPSASFTINVSVPIFRASNWSRLKNIKLQMAELEDNRTNTLRNLNMAADSYRTNMMSSLAQVNSNSIAVAQAEKALSISNKRYEVGRGTILEVNQSQTALTQAQLTYNQSIYDYLTSKSDFDYTLGKETYLK
ncbi:MAG: TolC family protein [Bacteroidaceae bacterium]|nr:TolC family protein [Bacteroidaceae bacterium]